MPRNNRDHAREPDDLKEGERMAKVGRPDRDAYEDIEEARAPSRRDNDDIEEIDDDDIVEVTDIDVEDKR